MKKSILVAALALMSTTAAAHTMWFKPSVFNLPKEERAQFVDVDIALGEHPFEIERALKPDAVKLIDAKNTVHTLEVTALNSLKSNVLVELQHEGTHKLVAEFGPTVRKPKPGTKSKRPPTRTFTRLVSFLTVGAPTASTDVAANYLDVKALTLPADIVAEEAFELQFFNQGKAASQLEVTFVKEGGAYLDQPQSWTFTTDEAGKLSVTLDDAGRYWVKAGVSEELENDAEAKFLRSSLGLALEVQVN
ncbi:DUF4198 domain-containing protein [Pseudoalteromonas xiamenensis]